MSFEFRNFQIPEDEERVLELLLTGFPELKGTRAGTLEHLRWKFSRSVDPPTCLIGFEGKRPVSFYGVIPQCYRVEGVNRQVGLVVDVMSHPEVRRRGLFEASGRAAIEYLSATKVEAVLGFPIRNDVMPGHLKVGWKAGFHLPVYLMPIGSPFTVVRPTPTWISFLGLGATGYRVISRPLRHGRAVISDSLDITDLLVHQALQPSDRHSLQTNRLSDSEEFLNWRLSRPGADYQIVSVEDTSSSGVAIIRRQLLRGVEVLCVLQMWVTNKAATRALSGALVHAAQRAGLAAIAMCTNPSHAAALGLVRAGFLRSPLKFTLIYRTTSDYAIDDWFSDESKWALSWLDSDTT